MKRRTLFKTLFGTVLATALPTPTFAEEPWISELKNQTDSLIKKWEPILLYTSKYTPELPKHKWPYLACLMEYRESQFIKEPNGIRFLKLLIPFIRQKQEDVRFEKIVVNNQRQVVMYDVCQYLNEYDMVYYKTHLVDGVDICEKTNTVTVTIS